MLMRVVRSLVVLACMVLAMSGAGYPAEPTKLKEKVISTAALIERVRADSGEKMWASELVADEKLTVLLDAKDAPRAREALDLLPGYQWVTCVQPDGTRLYVLGPDFGERELWAKRDAAADEESNRLCNNLGKRRLRQYLDALKLSPSQLDELIEKDPNLVYELRDPGRRLIMEHLAGLPQEVLDTVFTPDGFSARISELPSEMAEALIRTARGSHDALMKHGEPQKGSVRWENLEPALRQRGTVNVGGHVYGPDDGIGVGLSVPSSPESDDVSWGSQHGSMRPPGYFAEGIREKLRLAQGMSKDQAKETAKSEISAWWKMYHEAERAVLADRAKNRPPRFGSRDAPDMKLKRAVQGGSGYELLQELSDIGGLTLVCHYFERSDTDYETAMLDVGTSLGSGFDKAVDKLDWRFCNVWAYKNNSILATSADFVDKLETEIPAHIVAKWRDRAAFQGGALTLDDLAEMATDLTDKQMDIWAMPRDLARTGANNLRFEPSHMRLYASLNPEQRAQAWASGVPYTRMNRKQRRLFEKVAASYEEQSYTDAPVPDSFKLEIETENEQRSAHGWRAVIPTYSFKGLSPAKGYIGVKALNKSEVKHVAVKQSVVAAPPPIPSEPKSLAIAAALAKWSYVALRPETGTSEARAVVETKAGDEIKRRLLGVGKALEGVELTGIEPEGLTFRFGGATLTLPASRAVSLQPYDLDAISRGNSWPEALGKLMDY